MIQLFTRGVFLDLISEEDISITIELQDISDITAKPGSYSETFRLPSTSTNDNFFKYYFDVNSVDFDPTKKIDCDILHDGILFKSGVLRLDEVIINDAGVIVEYSCFFVGEIGSFAAEVGDETLNTLNLDAYSHSQNFISITDSWNYNLFDGDIVYGMIDWGYTYNNNCFKNCEPRIIKSTNVQDKPITDPTYAYTIKQWRPSIRVKAIIDAIFAETSFTYKSNFLSGITPLSPTKTFRDLYFPIISNEAGVNINEETQNDRMFAHPSIASTSFGNSETIICNDSVLIDEGNNYTVICGIPDIRYTCPTLGQYQIEAKATGSIVALPGATFVIVRIVKNINGTRVNLDQQQFLTNVAGTFNFDIDCVFQGLLSVGDEICMTIEGINLSSGSFTSTVPISSTHFRVIEAPQRIPALEDFLQNDYKKIDFLKDIFTLFNLVVIPDKDNSKRLLIEPYNDYIASGKIYDWTYKIDRGRDISIKPIIYEQTRTIIFKMREDTDVFNQRHQDQLKRNYGQYDYISTSDVITGIKEIETEISASPFGNQEDDPATNFAPMVELHQLQNSIRTPIRPNPRILFYNGLTQSLAGQQYFQDDNNDSITYSVYPRMLSVSELPTTDTSLHLQFTPDRQYGSSYSATAGVGFYQKYWENYIDSLYDKRAKQMTGNFVLSEEDVKGLEFSDVIFVKDSYWRVLKIEGIVPDKKVSARATLLKLYDYSPITTTTTIIPVPTPPPFPLPSLPYVSPTPTPTPTPTQTLTPTPTKTTTPTPTPTKTTTPTTTPTPSPTPAAREIFVGGSFTQSNTTAINRFYKMFDDGTADTSFNSNLGSGFDNFPSDIKILPDGKSIVCGSFGVFNGNTRNRLLKLNSNGTEDTSFYTNLGTGFDGQLFSIQIQSDNKLLISGIYTTFNGNIRSCLVRLNSDGTEDTAFYSNLGSSFVRNGGGNPSVRDTKLQSDGKIICGGSFEELNGNIRKGLIRLNTDGTEDTSFYTNLGSAFNPGATTEQPQQIEIQTDNKILVGGNFTIFNGNTRNGLIRLNSDGTEDTSFYSNLGTGFGAGSILDIEIQADNKIIILGSFTTFNGNTRNRVVRLNSDGTEDTSFYTNLGSAFNNITRSIVQQSDGKLLIGGSFTQSNSNTRNRLIRLNSDGTEDTSFYTNLGLGFSQGIFRIAIGSAQPITPTPTSSQTATPTQTPTNSPTPTRTPTPSACACATYTAQNTSGSSRTLAYTDCSTGQSTSVSVSAGATITVCSCTTPEQTPPGANFVITFIQSGCNIGGS